MNILVHEPNIPGNLGNIVRSAAGFFPVEHVYIFDYNGLTIPSDHQAFRKRILAISQGGWDKVNPVIFYKQEQLEQFLQEYQGRQIATVCNDSDATWLYNLDCREDDLVILGNERNGLPFEMIEVADQRLNIPIRAQMHSLNIASAFAAIAYEYARQAYVNHRRQCR